MGVLARLNALDDWAERRGLLRATQVVRPRPRVRPGLVVWLFGLTAALSGIGIFVPPVWSSAHLVHPLRATAISVEFHPSCARCTNVYVDFFDAHHLEHYVELHSPTNATHYRPGMQIVYSATNPGDAMALNSYNEGRGFDRTVGIPATAVLLAVEILTGASALMRWLLGRHADPAPGRE